MIAKVPLPNPQPLSAECRLLDSIAQLREEAYGLLKPARQTSPYDRIEWLERTAEHIAPERPLVIASARLGPHALWLPIRRHSGGEGHGLASWYTLAFAPIITTECTKDVRAQLLQKLAMLLRKSFGTLHLWPLEPEVAAEIEGAFRSAGWLARNQVETAHWVAHTRGLSFDDYWQQRASKLRNTVRRRAQKFPVETRIFTRFDATAWADYEAIYAASWKPAEGSPQFLRAFAQEAGENGSLRLGIALRDGVAVAAQFWTIDDGVATIHKLAHIESDKGQSPGTLLSHAMFQHVIDQDRPDMIDYGNGDEGYKAEWMDERRVRYRLRLLNPFSLYGLTSGVAIATRALTSRLRS